MTLLCVHPPSAAPGVMSHIDHSCDTFRHAMWGTKLLQYYNTSIQYYNTILQYYNT